VLFGRGVCNRDACAVVHAIGQDFDIILIASSISMSFDL